MNASELEQLVIELQTKLAFQEDSIEELNGVIVRQDKTLYRLEKRVTELLEKVKDIAPADPEEHRDPADEIPPHY